MASGWGGQIVGLEELRVDLAAINADLPSELQDANARIGPRAVGRAYPTPVQVGSGDGATPRVVVDGRTLRIEAGGPWRAAHQPEAAWGSEPGSPRGFERPYLVRALESEMPAVEGEYMGAVMQAAAKIGWPVTQMIRT
jgi:hypothetical protein